ncbi:MAG: radical SAM family heme chaperone HemW [Gammaproteobacteria bacterium]|jgi:oxygen-independent coproporphyrinogen-3 oxidase
MNTIPTSLYIHMPWCIRKCPYCDFNSYAASKIDENKYIEILIYDFQTDLQKFPREELTSIFIGGGTPSLFSANAIAKLLHKINQLINFKPDLEISMEINPSTCNQKKLFDLRAAGINRLSIGVQSFQNEKLKSLGRIHNKNDAISIIKMAHLTKFDNINLDLIFGLPNQTCHDALFDLQTAIALQPTHLSWYQLTIEKNTAFGKNPPTLPNEETILNMQQQGTALLTDADFNQYEISNFCKSNYECQHNLNYWQFGDYLAIGAGAHGKITTANKIIRYVKPIHPEDYIPKQKTSWTPRSSRGVTNIVIPRPVIPRPVIPRPVIPRPSLLTAGSSSKIAGSSKKINKESLPLEFMLNALRLVDGVPIELFEQCTGLKLSSIKPQLKTAIDQEFIEDNNDRIKPTKKGQQFLNQCLEIFV